MKTQKILLFVFVIALLSVGCEKEHNYAPTPKIDLKYVEVKDSIEPDLGVVEKYYLVTFKIVDGDGNFGIDTNHTSYKDSVLRINYFAKMYFNDNGNIYEFELPEEMNLDGMIPFVPPVGLNKYYRATIIREFSIPIQIDKPIRFEFFVIDNEKNESNKQITPWIMPDFTGILLDTNELISEE